MSLQWLLLFNRPVRIHLFGRREQERLKRADTMDNLTHCLQPAGRGSLLLLTFALWEIFSYFCCVLTFIKIKIFLENYKNVEWVRSRSGPMFCQPRLGSKLFEKVNSREQKSRYRKFRNFCENFIFANSVKRHVCHVKNLRIGHDLATSVNYSHFTISREF